MLLLFFLQRYQWSAGSPAATFIDRTPVSSESLQ